MHADVLKMAKSKEQREAIKWFHARRVFFEEFESECENGLALARESEHPDARFLASLFPGAAPATLEAAMPVFLAQRDEPRCMCCSIGPIRVRSRVSRGAGRFLSSLGGYAWGALYHCFSLRGDKKQYWVLMDKAVAQGEPSAMFLGGFYALKGLGPVEQARAAQWLRQGAELGDASCQELYGKNCCTKGSVAKFEWLRRAALQGEGNAVLGFKRLL